MSKTSAMDEVGKEQKRNKAAEQACSTFRAFAFFAVTTFAVCILVSAAQWISRSTGWSLPTGSIDPWASVQSIWGLTLLRPLLAGLSIFSGVALMLNSYGWLGRPYLEALTATACIWGAMFGFAVAALTTPEGQALAPVFAGVTAVAALSIGGGIFAAKDVIDFLAKPKPANVALRLATALVLFIPVPIILLTVPLEVAASSVP